MQAFAKTLDDRLKAMGAEYQAKVADAQARAETMTQTEKDMVVREIGELEQRIQAAQQKAQEDLDKQEEELLKPMVDRTNAGDQRRWPQRTTSRTSSTPAPASCCTSTKARTSCRW